MKLNSILVATLIAFSTSVLAQAPAPTAPPGTATAAPKADNGKAKSDRKADRKKARAEKKAARAAKGAGK